MKRVAFFSAVIILSIVSFSSKSQAGLIINLTDGGGTAPITAGGGSLANIMREAADVWELAFNSNSFSHALEIEYRWEALANSTLGVHSLRGEGGSPIRETSALIRFDSDGSSRFFMDSSLNGNDPLGSGNSEYTTFATTSADFGGGSMNTGRVFTGATGDAVGRIDLYTVALHEIGHALGLSSAFTGYQDESWQDNDVDVTSGPFAGSAIPTNNSAVPANRFTSNAHIPVGSASTGALLFPSITSSVRKLPAAIDIVANGQLSQFSNANFALSAIPEPSAFALLASVLIPLQLRRRSRSAV